MIATISLCLLATLLLLTHIWFKWNFSYWSKHKHIPSVPGRIFSDSFRNVITMKTNFYAHLQNIHGQSEFRDQAVIGIYSAYKPCLLIRDPQLVKEILLTDFECFRERNAASSQKHDPLGCSMMFFAPYSLGREMRLKFTQFLSTGKLKKLYPNIQEICVALEQRLAAEGAQAVLDFWHLSGSYVIDVLASFVGITSNCLNDSQALLNVILQMGNYNLTRVLSYVIIFFIPSLSNIFRARIVPKHLETLLKSYFEKALKEREQTAIPRKDVIDFCVQFKRDFKGTEQELKTLMDGLIAQAVLMLIAGLETTMVAITYVMYELAKHRDVQEKLREQLMAMLQETNGEIVWDSLNKLEYLDCVVNETLRLYPPLQTVERQYNRTSERNYTLSPHYDFTIPDGMPIYISIAGLNLDPMIWPNPTQYDPDRFLAENMKPINHMAFIPFGDGPRNCIGGRMGVMMIKAFVAHVLRSYSVCTCEQTQSEIKFNTNATTLQPRGGVYLRIIRDELWAKRREV